MGTRNLTMVVHNNKYVVAQYGQWDGYPAGQGQTILDFLNDKFNKEKFIKKLSNTKVISHEDVDALYQNNHSNFESTYPTLCRDMAAKVLEHIQTSNEEVLLSDSVDFVADSLFCEWAYVIDLDTDTFEVHQGFNQRKLGKGQRFFFLQKAETKYFPVRLKSKCSLSELPKKINEMKGLKNAA